jgi:type IV pilus assembly protein PilM
MADQRLIKYVQDSYQKGFTKEQIRKTLLKAYWLPAEIEEALKEVDRQLMAARQKEAAKKKGGFFSKFGLFGNKTKGLALRKQKPISGLDAYLGKKPVFGLDISDYSLEAVQLTPKKGIIKLSGLGRLILKPNIVKDGAILQPEELSRSIIDLLTNIKFGKIRTNDMVCCLPESQIFSHIFKFPKNLKKEQIDEAIKYEAQGIIPIDLNEAYYDLLLTSGRSDDKDNTSKEQEVFLVAAKKQIVDNYVQALTAAGLKPISLENESFSLVRSLFRKIGEKAPKTPAGVPVPLRGTMILDLGARTTNLSIADRTGIRMAVNIPIAGDKFTETIARALGISFLEADKMKREYGLNPDVRQGKQFQALAALLNEIFTEIKRAIQYYELEKKGKINKILLAGGSAQLPGLIQYFVDNLSGPINQQRSLSEKIEIQVGNPWIGIELDASLAPRYLKENMGTVLDNIKIALARRSILYATAIGVALRGISKDPAKAGINLLPKK